MKVTNKRFNFKFCAWVRVQLERLKQSGEFGIYLMPEMSYLNNRFVSSQFSIWY